MIFLWLFSSFYLCHAHTYVDNGFLVDLHTCSCESLFIIFTFVIYANEFNLAILKYFCVYLEGVAFFKAIFDHILRFLCALETFKSNLDSTVNWTYPSKLNLSIRTEFIFNEWLFSSNWTFTFT